MSYNTKNFFVQGGEEIVIGGKVILTPESIIVDERTEPIRFVPPSGATTAANAVKDLNALIANLKEAHLISALRPTLTLNYDQTEFEVEKEEALSLSVEAQVTDGRALAFQWYSNSSQSTEGGSPLSGATSPVLEVETSIAGTVYYYCIVSEATEAATKAFADEVSTLFTVVTKSA